MSGRKSGKKPTEQQGSRTYRGSYPCLRKTPEIVVDQFDEDDEEDNQPQSDDEETTIQALRTVIHKQAEMIQKLDREILQLKGKNGRNCTCQKPTVDEEDMLSYINCKLDLLTEQVLFISKKVAHDRRCRGYCVKHVRTKKCLCRGFEAAHRCCGRIGSICDC